MVTYSGGEDVSFFAEANFPASVEALLFFGSEFPVGDRPYFFSEANFPSATALTFFRKRISCRRQHLLFFGSKFPVADSTYFFSEANFPASVEALLFSEANFQWHWPPTTIFNCQGTKGCRPAPNRGAPRGAAKLAGYESPPHVPGKLPRPHRGQGSLVGYWITIDN